MLSALRKKAGIEVTADMRLAAREREARADKYDGHDMSVSRRGLLAAGPHLTNRGTC